MWISKSSERRIVGPGLRKAPGPEKAAVAVPARAPAGRRIVAAPRQTVVDAQREAAADDVGLRQLQERGEDRQRAAFDARARGQRGHALERPGLPRPPAGKAGVACA